MKKCKKCLLREAGESVTYEEITAYLETISDLLTDKTTVEKRLEYCKNCDSLISGTCLKCGCYVEVRASLKDGACPSDKWRL